MEKANKQQKDMITKNNQIFRQRMSTLGNENAQLKSDLQAAQESAATSEERDALKTAAPAVAESTSAPPTEELERLRKEKRSLEQALREIKSEVPPEAKAVPENWEAEKAELVKIRDEAMTQAKVE
jgi:hypothetical protein